MLLKKYTAPAAARAYFAAIAIAELAYESDGSEAVQEHAARIAKRFIVSSDACHPKKRYRGSAPGKPANSHATRAVRQAQIDDDWFRIGAEFNHVLFRRTFRMTRRAWDKLEQGSSNICALNVFQV